MPKIDLGILEGRANGGGQSTSLKSASAPIVPTSGVSANLLKNYKELMNAKQQWTAPTIKEEKKQDNDARREANPLEMALHSLSTGASKWLNMLAGGDEAATSVGDLISRPETIPGFVASTAASTVAAPLVGLEQGYEALTGNALGEDYDEETNTVPVRKLSTDQAAWSGVNAGINILGPMFGGSRSFLSGAKNVATSVARKATGSLGSEAAKKAAQKAAEGTTGWIKKATGSTAGQVIADMGEEGVEEFVQAYADAGRSASIGDDTFHEALEAAGLGAVGGGLLTGGGMAMNKFASAINPLAPAVKSTASVEDDERLNTTPNPDQIRYVSAVRDLNKDQAKQNNEVPGAMNFTGAPIADRALGDHETHVGVIQIREAYLNDRTGETRKAIEKTFGMTQDEMTALFSGKDTQYMASILTSKLTDASTIKLYRQPGHKMTGGQKVLITKVFNGSYISASPTVVNAVNGDGDGDRYGAYFGDSGPADRGFIYDHMIDPNTGKSTIDWGDIGNLISDLENATNRAKAKNQLNLVLSQIFTNPDTVKNITKQIVDAVNDTSGDRDTVISKVFGNVYGLLKQAYRSRGLDEAAASVQAAKAMDDVLYSVRTTGNFITLFQQQDDALKQAMADEAELNVEAAKNAPEGYQRQANLGKLRFPSQILPLLGFDVSNMQYDNNMLFRLFGVMNFETKRNITVYEGMDTDERVATWQDALNLAMGVEISGTQKVNAVESMFHNAVLNEFLVLTEGWPRITNKEKVEEVFQKFATAWNTIAEEFNKAIKEPHFDQLCLTLGYKKKDSLSTELGDLNPVTTRAFYEAMSDRTMEELFNIAPDDDLFGMSLQGYVEQAAQRTNFDPTALSDVGEQIEFLLPKFVDAATSRAEGAHTALDSAIKACAELISEIERGKVSGKISREQEIEGDLVLDALVRTIGLTPENVNMMDDLGLLSIDTVFNTPEGRRLFNSNPEIVKNTLAEISLRIQFEKLIKEYDALVKKGEDTSSIVRRIQYKAIISPVHQMIANEITHTGKHSRYDLLIDPEKTLADKEKKFRDEQQGWLDRTPFLIACLKTDSTELALSQVSTKLNDAKVKLESAKKNTYKNAQDEVDQFIAVIAGEEDRNITAFLQNQAEDVLLDMPESIIGAMVHDARGINSKEAEKTTVTRAMSAFASAVFLQQNGGMVNSISQMQEGPFDTIDEATLQAYPQPIIQLLFGKPTDRTLYVYKEGYGAYPQRELTQASLYQELIGVEIGPEGPTAGDMIAVLRAYPRLASHLARGVIQYQDSPTAASVTRAKRTDLAKTFTGWRSIKNTDGYNREKAIRFIKAQIWNQPQLAAIGMLAMTKEEANAPSVYKVGSAFLDKIDQMAESIAYQIAHDESQLALSRVDQMVDSMLVESVNDTFDHLLAYVNSDQWLQGNGIDLGTGSVQEVLTKFYLKDTVLRDVNQAFRNTILPMIQTSDQDPDIKVDPLQSIRDHERDIADALPGVVGKYIDVVRDCIGIMSQISEKVNADAVDIENIANTYINQAYAEMDDFIDATNSIQDKDQAKQLVRDEVSRMLEPKKVVNLLSEATEKFSDCLISTKLTNDLTAVSEVLDRLGNANANFGYVYDPDEIRDAWSDPKAARKRREISLDVANFIMTSRIQELGISARNINKDMLKLTMGSGDVIREEVGEIVAKAKAENITLNPSMWYDRPVPRFPKINAENNENVFMFSHFLQEAGSGHLQLMTGYDGALTRKYLPFAALRNNEHCSEPPVMHTVQEILDDPNGDSFVNRYYMDSNGKWSVCTEHVINNWRLASRDDPAILKAQFGFHDNCSDGYCSLSARASEGYDGTEMSLPIVRVIDFLLGSSVEPKNLKVRKALKEIAIVAKDILKGTRNKAAFARPVSLVSGQDAAQFRQATKEALAEYRKDIESTYREYLTEVEAAAYKGLKDELIELIAKATTPAIKFEYEITDPDTGDVKTGLFVASADSLSTDESFSAQWAKIEQIIGSNGTIKTIEPLIMSFNQLADRLAYHEYLAYQEGKSKHLSDKDLTASVQQAAIDSLRNWDDYTDKTPDVGDILSGVRAVADSTMLTPPTADAGTPTSRLKASLHGTILDGLNDREKELYALTRDDRDVINKVNDALEVTDVSMRDLRYTLDLRAGIKFGASTIGRFSDMSRGHAGNGFSFVGDLRSISKIPRVPLETEGYSDIYVGDGDIDEIKRAWNKAQNDRAKFLFVPASSEALAEKVLGINAKVEIKVRAKEEHNRSFAGTISGGEKFVGFPVREAMNKRYYASLATPRSHIGKTILPGQIGYKAFDEFNVLGLIESSEVVDKSFAESNQILSDGTKKIPADELIRPDAIKRNPGKRGGFSTEFPGYGSMELTGEYFHTRYAQDKLHVIIDNYDSTNIQMNGNTIVADNCGSGQCVGFYSVQYGTRVIWAPIIVPPDAPATIDRLRVTREGNQIIFSYNAVTNMAEGIESARKQGDSGHNQKAMYVVTEDPKYTRVAEINKDPDGNNTYRSVNMEYVKSPVTKGGSRVCTSPKFDLIQNIYLGSLKFGGSAFIEPGEIGDTVRIKEGLSEDAKELLRKGDLMQGSREAVEKIMRGDVNMVDPGHPDALMLNSAFRKLFASFFEHQVPPREFLCPYDIGDDGKIRARYSHTFDWRLVLDPVGEDEMRRIAHFMYPTLIADTEAHHKDGDFIMDPAGNMLSIVLDDAGNENPVYLAGQWDTAFDMGFDTSEEAPSSSAKRDPQMLVLDSLRTGLNPNEIHRSMALVASEVGDPMTLFDRHVRAQREMLQGTVRDSEKKAEVPGADVILDDDMLNDIVGGDADYLKKKRLIDRHNYDAEFKRQLNVVGVTGDPMTAEERKQYVAAINDLRATLGESKITYQIADNTVRLLLGYTENDGAGIQTIPINRYVRSINIIIHNMKTYGLPVVGGVNYNAEAEDNKDRIALPYGPYSLMKAYYQSHLAKEKFDTFEEFMEAAVEETEKSLIDIGNLSSKKKKRALTNVLAYLDTTNEFGSLDIPLLYINDIEDVLDDTIRFLKGLDLNDTEYRAMVDRANEFAQNQRHQMKVLRESTNKRKNLTPGTEFTGKAEDRMRKDRRATSNGKFFSNATKLTRVNGLLTPFVWAATMIDKTWSTNFERRMMIAGHRMKSKHLKELQGSIRKASQTDEALAVFRAFLEANYDGNMNYLDPEKATEYLDAKEKTKGFDGFYRKIMRGMGAANSFNPKMLDTMLSYFVVECEAEGRDWWFEPATDGSGKTMIQSYLEADPAKFLATILGEGPGGRDRGAALRAINYSLRGDMGQENIVSLMYSEIAAGHSATDFFGSILLSPYMRFATNAMGRMLNPILPMSALHYVVSQKAMSAAKDAGREDLAIKIENIQFNTSLGQALLYDAAHMAPMMVAAILIALGLIGAPPDDDKRNNYEEYTIAGMRIGETWVVGDVLGPILPMACTIRTWLDGKPRADVLINGVSDCLAGNPFLKMSDVLTNMVDPMNSMISDYIDDVEEYSDAPGGVSVSDYLIANASKFGLNTLNRVLTPSIIRDILRNDAWLDPYEQSYKRVYKEDATGQIIRDSSGNPLTEKTTYLDAQLRYALRYNLLAGTVFNIFANPSSTSYLENGLFPGKEAMPRVAISDPLQREAIDMFSLYEEDSTTLLPIEEQNEIAIRAISILQGSDDMEELYNNGFILPYETKAYISQIIWDIIETENQNWNAEDYAGLHDPKVLGDGNWDEGKAILDEMKKEHYAITDYWESFYYDKLWSDELNQGMVYYWRKKTNYATDQYGNLYATNMNDRSLPFLGFFLGQGSVDNPEGTLGYEGDWNTPSAINGSNTGMRGLVQIPDMEVQTPSLDSWADEDNGGYSSSYKNGQVYGYNSGSYPYYPWGSYSKGGSSYAPSIYSKVSPPNTSTPRTMSADRIYGAEFDYLRPGFATQGSRQAYRREDI